jgi:hypothetical protein
MSYFHKTRRRKNVSALLLTVLLALSGGLSQAESLQDGPYVVRSADGGWVSRWIEGEAESPRVREQAVKVGDAVSIAAVGAMPAFQVALRADSNAARDEIKLSSRTPLFVMADTHGEFEIAAQLLQRQHIVDDELRWSFGKGHLAILGDVFDRGANQTELLWLIYKLEAEAARAGGGVHLAIGNHEAMVLSGDLRYLHPKYQRVAAALRAPSYAALWSEQSLLGRWLRSKAAVFRLGDYLCLHGGMSREVADSGLTLAEINNAVRASLTLQSPPASEKTALLMGREGPLWYRGYFETQAREGGFKVAESADIDVIRERFKVRKILVGHTMVPTITPLYDGRVIAVQVYPHRDKETHAPVMEALAIESGRMFRARVDGSREPLR